jgi:hypothetical protein
MMLRVVRSGDHPTLDIHLSVSDLHRIAVATAETGDKDITDLLSK